MKPIKDQTKSWLMLTLMLASPTALTARSTSDADNSIKYSSPTTAADANSLSGITALTITGTALPTGESAELQELRPAGVATGTFETFVRLQPGTWTLQGTDANGQTVAVGSGDDEGSIAADGQHFTVAQGQVVRIKVQTDLQTIDITPVQLFVKGNIAPANTILNYVGNGRFSSEVTLDDSSVFLFSDKYIYFALNDDDQLSLSRLTADRTKVGMSTEGFSTENIRINGGTYAMTVDLHAYTWQAEAPVDDYRISAFGSSVCNGQGADNFKGYAYQYGRLLQQRYADGTSPNPFYTSGISIGGNNTQNLIARYDEMLRNYSRYVIIGLSLGNEGIHESTDKQATVNQFATNLQSIVSSIKADGKVPVVMNNYTRGDFTLDDYAAVKQTNLMIHEWDVASVNTLGAIDDGTGKWATGYQLDNAHPTNAGHLEFLYAMTPSLFDALQSGKPQPVRDQSQQLTLSDGQVILFAGEGTVHPFTVAVRVKGNATGNIFTCYTTAGAKLTVAVDDEGHVVYTNASGRTLTSATAIADDDWHTVTLTHYFAQGRTLLYLDSEAAGELRERITAMAGATVGDASATVSRQISELFFWRSALSPDEVAAVCDGRLLKSSLELYVPATASLDNLAMSLNTVTLTTGDTAMDITPAKPLTSPYEGTVVQEGEEFYLYNVETGMWLQENGRFTADWNTRGELGSVGFDVELKVLNGGWQINPKFGHNQSMNGGNWYLDTSEATTAWTFEPVSMEGISNAYHIRYNGDYLHATPAPELKLIRDAIENQATWQIVTREQRISHAIETATAEAPVDLSFLIRANDFTQEDTRKSAFWTLTDNDNGGSNWTSGRFSPENRQNSVFEAWNMTHMDFYQTVSGLPAGNYEVQVQAAYSPTDAAGMNRNDLDAYNDGTMTIYGRFYANDEQTVLPTVYTMQYPERTGHFAAKDLNGIWIMDGVNQFSYSVANNPESFKCVLPVALGEDEDLKLGIRVTDAPTKTIWVLADKFRLRYLGTGNTETGITTPQASATAGQGASIYDLHGRKCASAANLPKGIYIIGGRKMIVN